MAASPSRRHHNPGSRSHVILEARDNLPQESIGDRVGLEVWRSIANDPADELDAECDLGLRIPRCELTHGGLLQQRQLLQARLGRNLIFGARQCRQRRRKEPYRSTCARDLIDNRDFNFEVPVDEQQAALGSSDALLDYTSALATRL